jgi:nucleotide-binding universal stress UspA family protein
VDEPDDAEVTFRSVVCGTDLTSASLGAAQYAALFARHYDADLILAHAFALVQPALEVEALRHEASTQRLALEAAASDLLDTLGPHTPHSMTVVREGRPVPLVQALSEEKRPSLVVLGTHAGGALERHMIGSVAEELLRTLPGPVLTVGPHVPAPRASTLAIARILHATDFSPASVRAAGYAKAMARAFGSQLEVLHVTPSGARSETTDVRDHILECAQEQHSDLIIMGAHHHSWIARHLRTGPAFQVVLGATCPILTVCGSDEPR